MACCSLNQVGRIFPWREKREGWWSGPSLAFSFAAHQSPAPSCDVASSHRRVVLLCLASSHGASPSSVTSSGPGGTLPPLPGSSRSLRAQ